MEKYKVMIVDDQAISRRYFEMILSGSGRYEVVLSLSSAFAADVYLLKKKVDLILMDVLMNDGPNGLTAAEKIKQSDPEIRIVVVTSMPDASWMDRARRIGVESFWYKESERTEILDVLDRTMAGESVYPASAPPASLGNASRESFTDRELDVLRELADGKSNSEIANLLFVSENTIKTHVRTLLKKTGFTNRTELAAHARVVGLALHPRDD